MIFIKIFISSIRNDTTIIHLLSSRTKKHHKEQKQHKKAWNSRKRELLVKEKRVKNVMTSLWTRSREQQALKAAKYFSINTRREKFYYVSGIWLRKMHEGMLGSDFEGFFLVFEKILQIFEFLKQFWIFQKSFFNTFLNIFGFFEFFEFFL